MPSLRFTTARALALTLLAAALPVLAQAQYFGKNKPRYEQFDWTTYRTPHFAIYNYLERDSADAAPERLEWIGALSEDWYGMHRRVLRNELPGRNLMLLYDNHADFQQTNAIQGGIGIGTGGVTEAFKNRVIFPFALSNHQTDHVLGHELVHAFQYDIVLNGDSTSLRNLANLPLWMVEGLAEYLSIGRVDAHTSMWMRDAVLNDDVPTMKQLNNPKYFPYRWGQAWWAFVTGLKGDDVIRPYFEETAKVGLEAATLRVMGMSVANLSKLWVDAVTNHYRPYLEQQTSAEPPGKLLVSEDDGGGSLNIAPVVSPDGRYVIFLSEKNLFSIDLFLADARSGRIVRQVTSKTRAGHIDDFAYVESAGTWAPKSDRFAYVAVSKGRNILVVSDVERGRVVREIAPEGLQAFDNPAWSPDGRSIVVSGLAQGQVDLYSIDVATERVTQLTDDFASELLPSWNAAGTELVYARDGGPTGKAFDIAVLDVATGAAEVLDLFDGAANLNPGFDHEGHVVFVSNRDGFRDLYRYDRAADVVYQLTDLKTGVSGITAYAPAVSTSPRRDRIAYTYLHDGDYSIYSGKRDRFLNEVVTDRGVDLAPATLPTVNERAPRVVDALLGSRTFAPAGIGAYGAGAPVLAPAERADAPPTELRRPSLGDARFGVSDTDYAYVPLRNPFRLDFVGGGAGVGASLGNPALGTQAGAAGSVNALFSDVLGNQQLFVGAGVNGQIYDFSAQVGYVNRTNPLGWGVSLSHIPFLTGGFLPGGALDTIPGTDFEAVRFDVLEQRIFQDRVGAFVDYPFSRTFRVEAGVSGALYSFRQDVNELYYDSFGRLLAQDRRRLRENEPEGFALASVSAAAVGDNAVMGLASPLQGHRFRVGVEQLVGDFSYLQSTLDGRVYHRLAPVTFALRALHYGRHGLDPGENALNFPFFVGQPWYVRGLANRDDLNELGARNNFNLNALVGNNIGVVNAEVRLPFTGPRRLALIPFNGLYTELTAFVDGGLAYDDFGSVREYFDRRDAVDAEGNPDPGGDFASLSRPLLTAGVSLRANLFGALILEPYYARVINQEGAAWRFGLNFVPGW